jgi:hypothetical protein
MYLVLIATGEPSAALFRYAASVRDKYETLFVTGDVTRCLTAEAEHHKTVGRSGGTDIDRIVEVDRASVEAVLEGIEPWRGEVAGAIAWDAGNAALIEALGHRLDLQSAEARLGLPAIVARTSAEARDLAQPRAST